MTADPIAVREDATRGDAAEIVNTHEFLSLPIIDKAGKLVGAVRLDDVLGAALAQVGTGSLNRGGQLYVSFATGGKDDEHVRFVIRRGVVTEVDITKVSSEGKEHVEVRAPPAR